MRSLLFAYYFFIKLSLQLVVLPIFLIIRYVYVSYDVMYVLPINLIIAQRQRQIFSQIFILDQLRTPLRVLGFRAQFAPRICSYLLLRINSWLLLPTPPPDS